MYLSNIFIEYYMSKDELNRLTCNDELRQRVQANIDRFSYKTDSSQGKRKAAVALTIVELEDDPGVYGMNTAALSAYHAAIILTRRTSRLNSHAGQWALPGGRIDDGETAEEAALRELSEEVGLTLSNDQVIGRLDDYTTRSGYIMTPVVIWGGADVMLNPNPAEVHSIDRIPINELLRNDAPLLDEMPELENPALMMPIGQRWIASPTGAVLYQFREAAIKGIETRVAHYEQPYFAWS